MILQALLVLCVCVLALACGALGRGWRRERERLQTELEALRARAGRLERGSAELERACGAKSTLLARVSHEIRTSLNGLSGTAERLSDTPLVPEQRELLATIQSSGGQLRAVVDDVFDFSRIEAGRLELECADFDLGELLEVLQRRHGAAAAEKELEFRCTIEDGTPRGFHGDALRLRQVLGNLVGNSLKYTSTGSIWVRAASAGADAQGRVRLRLEVRDTGVGIDPEAQARVFEPFSDAGAPAARRRSGTGLGLPIARQLVRLMGGTIEVESAPGAGSSFRVELPLQPRSLAPSRPGAPLEQAAHTLADLSGLCVLLVEDNLVNRKVAQAMLAQAGATILWAENGERALEILEREHARIGLVLMDCQMPVLDGLEATRRWRARERELGCRLPILALTANAAPAEVEACRAAGMDDHLAKPFMRSDLHPYVLRWAPRPAIGA